MKRALIFGAGGFIGSHMAKRLKSEGYWVRGVDLKEPDFSPTACDEFIHADLRDYENVKSSIALVGDEAFSEIYQFAADMVAKDLFALDINSRFETAPGIKNIALIEAFIQSLNNKTT